MNAVFKLAAIAAAIGLSSAAFAQAKSDVKINGTVEQVQSDAQYNGGDNYSRQLMDLGSVKGAGSSGRASDVTVTGTVRQYQVNTKDALQVMDIGNVESNGSSRVVVKDVYQLQQTAGNDAQQTMEIGSVKASGFSSVYVNAVTQVQKEVNKAQQEVKIGVIK